MTSFGTLCRTPAETAGRHKKVKLWRKLPLGNYLELLTIHKVTLGSYLQLLTIHKVALGSYLELLTIHKVHPGATGWVNYKQL